MSKVRDATVWFFGNRPREAGWCLDYPSFVPAKIERGPDPKAKLANTGRKKFNIEPKKVCIHPSFVINTVRVKLVSSALSVIWFQM
jgi:hypothetical protein